MTGNDEYWRLRQERVSALREYVAAGEALKQEYGGLDTSHIIIADPLKAQELQAQLEAAEGRFRRTQQDI